MTAPFPIFSILTRSTDVFYAVSVFVRFFSIMSDLEYPYACSPSLALWRNDNLVREWIRLICRDWGNVIFPKAGRGNDLKNRFL